MKNEEMFARGGGQETNKIPINKGNKTRKIITGILAVILLVLLIGVSYSIYNYTFTGQTNTIETERIELELLESTNEIISIENALPMSDDQGIKQTNTFNFAVTTRTASQTDLAYAINIEKLDVDTGYTSLNDEDIKVYLTDYNDNQLVSPTKISDLSNYRLYTGKNTHNSTMTEITDKYKLRVWIDQDVDASNWNENTKLQYKFKIVINSGAEENVTGIDTLNWDGDINGHYTQDQYWEEDGMGFVHVSDTVPTLDELANGGTLILNLDGSSYNFALSTPRVMESGSYYIEGEGLGPGALVIPEDRFWHTNEDYYEKKGIYFLYAESLYTSSLTINGYTGFPQYN